MKHDQYYEKEIKDALEEFSVNNINRLHAEIIVIVGLKEIKMLTLKKQLVN